MSQSTRTGIGFPALLGVALIVLKLTHVISWPWIWVLAPLWVGYAAVLSILLAMGGALLVILALDKIWGRK